MLFHYHFWTPYVEETEKFYEDNGFYISQRIGKYQGKFQSFNPPLIWDDFRNKNILFRIIEAKKGNGNITFGYGKKIMFDHIGFLVSKEEHDKICDNAKVLSWKAEISDRRTFIKTPYEFDIELQTHSDVVDLDDNTGKLERITIMIKSEGLEKDLTELFGKEVQSVQSVIGEKVTIKEAIIKGFLTMNTVDPNGVNVFNCV
ncbi:hypothetical protein BIV60_17035 [Bacillus sp. MUM 116]|uniref:hypothetical protein n=1 Tax=Bacillus sp. MUM 116 TaxID=1678002 RepID=UPI0008F5A5E4|nr:hypothetical protein [Bacillus sp. MUM 116]OIK12079.1 hypothetical protein BIV60_17035 [Bacillus sp. MUM 116]